MKGFCSWFVCLLLLAIAAPANAVVLDRLDLNEFYRDPESAVAISLDGSVATLAEDPVYATLLSDDPSMGDPELIRGAAGVMLAFDYAFNEADGNDDFFYAFLFDDSNHQTLYDLDLSDSASGTVRWDLTGYQGQLLGLEFQLNPFDWEFDSTVTISNVRLETVDAPVPEPATLLLVGAGMAGLTAWRKKRC